MTAILGYVLFIYLCRFVLLNNLFMWVSVVKYVMAKVNVTLKVDIDIKCFLKLWLN